MKVKQLIEVLKNMPEDSEVFHIYDGEPRACLNVVYLSKSGSVMTSGFDNDVYSQLAMPINHNGFEYTTPHNPDGFGALSGDWDFVTKNKI